MSEANTVTQTTFGTEGLNWRRDGFMRRVKVNALASEPVSDRGR